MSTQVEEQLRLAHTASNQGNRHNAQQILMGVVRDFPNDARGWYALSQFVDDTERELYCLNKVLELIPNNKQATDRKNQIIFQQVFHPKEENQITDQQVFKDHQEEEYLNEDTTPKINNVVQDTDTDRFGGVIAMAFVAAAGIIVGTFFPWFMVTYDDRLINKISGILAPPGIITFLVGGYVLFRLILGRDKRELVIVRTAPFALPAAGLIWFYSFMHGYTYEETTCFPGLVDVCHDYYFGGGISLSLWSMVIYFGAYLIIVIMEKTKKR